MINKIDYHSIKSLFILTSCFLPAMVFAQVDTNSLVKTPSKPIIPKSVTAAVAADTTKISEILKVRINSAADSNRSRLAMIEADYIVIVTISNPKAFLLQRPMDNSELLLYANGIPLKGMVSTYFSEMPQQTAKDNSRFWPPTLDIPFIFKQDSSNRDAWNSLFRLAHWNKNRIGFDLSIGWSGMFPLTYADPNHKKSGARVILLFYKPAVFWCLVILYVAFIFYFIYFCHSTGLIRDPDDIDGSPGPYSLAQTQLAFWTVIVIGGFGYLILLTGLSDSINHSVLLLLGISGGTTGVAGFIDYYKKQTTIKGANPDVPAAAIPTKKHRSFILDILSDGINISVQRTQIAMWNLVLGIYFVFYVISNKSMPVFNDTLLYLAGVSSVLYLTSKGPENPAKPPVQPAPIVNQQG